MPKLIQGKELFDLYQKKIQHEKKVIKNLIEKKNQKYPGNPTPPIGDYETITEAMKIEINKLINY